MATTTSLSYANQQFLLKGKPLRIFSGAIHYFRVVPECWRDRLLKAKACGLNTVETYVSWNLHEPKPGVFNGDGILNVRKFVQIAGELGLYVIFRPGPYICSEWDFGGLPSWLLADPEMKVRTNYPGYQKAVRRFFGWLLPQVADLQFSNGGPVIAVQVENEYGSFSEDPAHLSFVRDVLLENGITELLVTSDNESASKTAPILNGVMPTANGQTVEEVQATFELIHKVNNQYPLMIMEFWSGWFDHWGYPHDARSIDIMVRTLEYALDKKASVNFYMFFGGTNFGFMAGALSLSKYKADVTSYDYDAPLAEDGRVTAKFWKIREMLRPELEKIGVDVTKIPDVPDANNRASAPFKLQLQETMNWPDLIGLVKKRTTSPNPQCMESYSYENGDVQSYGYVVYRKAIESSGGKQLALSGQVKDRASFLINGQTQGEADWNTDNPTVNLPGVEGAGQALDIVVENLGRVNYTTKDRQDVLQQQRKGFKGTVQLDGRVLEGWQVFALDFCEDYVQALSQSNNWKPLEKPFQNGPSLYRASFQLPGEPADYFVRLDGWHKGIVIVNGFNLGRYWDIGPQRTLYLPGPILRKGNNQVIVFEERSANQEISFEIEPCLD